MKLPAPKVQAALLRQAALDRRAIEYIAACGRPFTAPEFCAVMKAMLRGEPKR